MTAAPEEPPQLQTMIDYVDSLVALESAMCVISFQLDRSTNLSPSSNAFGQASANYKSINCVRGLSASQVSQVYTAYASASAKLDVVSHTVNDREAELGIKSRWTPKSPEYQKIRTEIQLRDYRLALDHLEYLVVQRMFELSKLGMSGVGEPFSSYTTPMPAHPPQVTRCARRSVMPFVLDRKPSRRLSRSTMNSLQAFALLASS